MYWAFWFWALFSTEGLVNCCLLLSWRMVPVLSNFRLKRFRALSMFSPSLTGMINISYNLLSFRIFWSANIHLLQGTVQPLLKYFLQKVFSRDRTYLRICLEITTFWISVVPSPMVHSLESR